jgi:phosphomannomutase
MQFTLALGGEKFFCQALRVAQIKFGTDGWRAVIAEDFTFANVARGGDAFLERVEFSFAAE